MEKVWEKVSGFLGVLFRWEPLFWLWELAGRRKGAMLLHEPGFEERMRRVRMLLETRFDYLPQVKLAKSAAVDGPAEARRVPCDACKESGEVAHGGTFHTCGMCGGTGRRLARKGDVPWDEYTELPLDEARSPRTISGGFNLREDVQRIDRELRKLRADEHARAGIVADEEPMWVRRQQMFRTGSYAALDDALVRLAATCSRLRGAVAVKYESQLPIVAEWADRLEPLAVAWLASKMPGPVFLPPQYEQELAADRNRSVDDLISAGWKTGRIARQLGVSAKTVQRARRRALDVRRAA